MNNILSKVYFALEKKDINKALFIFLLTLLASVTELVSIGLIIPILHMFAGEQVQYNIEFLPKEILSDSDNLLFLILGCFLTIYILKFFLNRFLIKMQNSFSHNLFANISKKFFKLYLNKDFSFYVKNNSSDLIRNTLSECNLFSMGVVFYLTQLISEIIIFTFICAFLIIYNFQISLIVIFLFTFLGLFLFKQNAKNLRDWGDKRQYHSAQQLKQLQQSFGSFRELIMNNLREIFYKNYSYHTHENTRFSIFKDTVTQMPRLILEILAVFVLAFIIYFLSFQGKSLSEILVLLGVFLYSTIRLLPSISKIVRSFQNIKYNQVVIDVILDGLKEYSALPIVNETNEFSKDKKRDFKKITLNNVNFIYSKENKIFKNLNLEIHKGDKIGIIGKTGSGKSTFVNILCGLLDVTKGEIYFDENNKEKDYKSIQNLIGYVPQTVSIFDESVQFNVCLSDDLTDEKFQKFQKVLEIVDMDTLVDSLPNNHNELVGENGSRFSGGQNPKNSYFR